jgi:hypothetical protein
VFNRGSVRLPDLDAFFAKKQPPYTVTSVKVVYESERVVLA